MELIVIEELAGAGAACVGVCGAGARQAGAAGLGARREEAAAAVLSLGTTHFREANAAVRTTLAEADTVQLRDVFAQRYLGCCLPAGKRLEIHGTPGNDLACYMDGGTVEVFGSAQDQIGNTMNGGCVVVHGRCGDAAGYAMRGGQLFVRDGVGWRVGINMKQYEARRPVIVIGGDAGAFLGEYMAGGIIVLLGRPGDHMASGMHGGVMYLRREALPAEVAPGLMVEELSSEDAMTLGGLLDQYSELFGEELAAMGRPAAWDLDEFVALRPASSRPYSSMYAS